MHAPDNDESELERKRWLRRGYMREYRKREDDEQRKKRLEREREYNKTRRVRPKNTNTGNRKTTQVSWSGLNPCENDCSGLEAISEEVKGEVRRRLQRSVGAVGLNECVCVVCDRLELRTRCKSVDSDDTSFFRKLRSSIGEIDPELPEKLVRQHDYSFMSDQLCGLLLSKEDAKVCYSEWFFIGEVPAALKGINPPERFLTQLVSVIVFTRVMRGGKHRCIRSHCMMFDANPSPPACLLPRSLSGSVAYRVVITGEITDAQEAKIRKMHRIRNEKVRKALTFYKENNVLYSEIEVDEDYFRRREDEQRRMDDELLIFASDADGVEVDREGQGIEGSRDDCRALTETEEVKVIERATGFVAADHPIDASQANVVEELTEYAETERKFLVRHSSTFARDNGGDLYAKMFPHLFPYGRGHPGESRKHPVSHQECIKHYMLLGCRRFAEDELFAFVSFDRISLEKMYVLTSLRCRRSPGLFEGFDELSKEELSEALVANEQRRQGRKPVRQLPIAGSRFLRSVEVSSSAVWGSAAERRYYRQQAFAYQTRFGQPTLFVTLTPNSDNSFVSVHYSGKSGADNLWDISTAKLPSRIDTRKTTMGDDAASARLFERQMEAFIIDVLRIDPVTKRQMPHKGLLGEVRAYFGMVETQGRGTLYGHFLIWLSGCPPNSECFEKHVTEEGDAFLNKAVQYGKSIMTAELPLSMNKGSCVNCGNSVESLIPMSVPGDARTSMLQRFSGKRVPDYIREPLLVQCSRCLLKMSSQHVLWRIVLMNRPLLWPPLMQELTRIEFDEQVKLEADCRGSFREAENVVHKRESTLLAANCSASDMSGSAILRDYGETHLAFLNACNAYQAPYFRVDEDSFFDDDMMRELEMTMPGATDERVGCQNFDLWSLRLRCDLTSIDGHVPRLVSKNHESRVLGIHAAICFHVIRLSRPLVVKTVFAFDDRLDANI